VAVVAASLFEQGARPDLVLSYWLLGSAVRSPHRRESELWRCWTQDLSISSGMDFLYERVQCLGNVRLERCERSGPELVLPDFLGLETLPRWNQGPHHGVRYCHLLTTYCLQWRKWGVDTSPRGHSSGVSLMLLKSRKWAPVDWNPVKMNRLPDGTHRGWVLDNGDKATWEWRTLNGLMTNTRTTTQLQQDDLEHVREIEQTRYTHAANNACWHRMHMFLVWTSLCLCLCLCVICICCTCFN